MKGKGEDEEGEGNVGVVKRKVMCMSTLHKVLSNTIVWAVRTWRYATVRVQRCLCGLCGWWGVSE